MEFFHESMWIPYDRREGYQDHASMWQHCRLHFVVPEGTKWAVFAVHLEGIDAQTLIGLDNSLSFRSALDAVLAPLIAYAYGDGKQFDLSYQRPVSGAQSRRLIMPKGEAPGILHHEFAQSLTQRLVRISAHQRIAMHQQLAHIIATNAAAHKTSTGTP